jgi:hypothetical protein
MLGIYLTTGKLVREGKPFEAPEKLQKDAEERNERAEQMGLQARYVVK